VSAKKNMGLWSAISIGVGGMVGGGIYSLLGTATQIAGNAMYISFIIAGITALLSAYSYAKLGAKFPSAGGPVEFLVRGFGDGIVSGGFNILLWIGYVFALSLYARAFGTYTMTFFPELSSYWLYVFTTSIVIFFTVINFIGSKAVGRSELFVVTVNLSVLIFFSIMGFFSIKPALLSPTHWPPVSNMFFASGVVFLTYEGFGLVTNAAEDMKNPRKTLPMALYISVAVVMLIYTFTSIAVIGNLPVPKIMKASDYAVAAAAKPFLGIIGFKLMAIAALFATSSAINATLYGGANVSYMIARDGELPRMFERKIWNKAPEGLFLTAALVILFSNFLDLGGIGMLGSSSFLLIYAAVNVGHLHLYKETGANLYIIWLAILGCITSFGILFYYLIIHSPITLVFLIIIFVLAFLAEIIYRRYTFRSLKVRNKI
jgi:amino acid transporter